MFLIKFSSWREIFLFAYLRKVNIPPFQKGGTKNVNFFFLEQEESAKHYHENLGNCFLFF